MILVEQPSSLIKGTHRKILKEVNLGQGKQNLEKKIMYSSLKKSCDKFPKTIEKQEGQLNKIDFIQQLKLTYLLCLINPINGRLIWEDEHSCQSKRLLSEIDLWI